MKTAGALLTLLLITVIPGMAGNEADADRGKLIALENAWNQAQMTKDVSGVEQLLAPMFIYTDYDGMVQDKKKFLDDLKDPALFILGATLNPEVLVQGRNGVEGRNLLHAFDNENSCH